MLKFILSALLAAPLAGCFSPKIKEYSPREYEEKFVKGRFYHMRLVQDNMFLLDLNRDKLPFEVKRFELVGRGLTHDLDKITKKPDRHFELFKYKLNEKNGIPNGRANIEELMTVKADHYEKNRHHFEYHIKNREPLTGVDICEIISDIYAVKIEKKEPFPQTIKFVKNLAKKYQVSEADEKNMLAVLNVLNDLRGKIN
jgi:hypothetical protein